MGADLQCDALTSCEPRVVLAVAMTAIGAAISLGFNDILYRSLRDRAIMVGDGAGLKRKRSFLPTNNLVPAHRQAALGAANSSLVVVGLPPALPQHNHMIARFPLPGDAGWVGGSATEAVRAALRDVKLNTEQQQEEWDRGLIAFETGAESCSAVCGLKGGGGEYVCARDWFLYIDVCNVAKSALPDLRCLEVAQAWAPAALPHTGQLMVSKDSKSDPPTCEAHVASSKAVRLCPCLPRARSRSPAAGQGEKAVAEVVRAELQQLVASDQIELQRAAKSGGNHQVRLESGGRPMSERMLADVEAGRVSFFKSEKGETCSSACHEQALKCSPRWFQVLNRCEVLLAAFPATPAGKDLASCGSQFYGHDLPGYQVEMQQLLLNKDIETFATTCSGRGDSTARICPCAYRYPNTRQTYHMVFNVESKQYFEWQSRYSVFWHKQVGQPGKITRLLSMGGKWPTDPTPHPSGDHLMKEVPTHVAPAYDYGIDQYVAHNKPLSITHWLQTADVKEDIIIVADPDCALISKVDIAVEEGSPVATQGYYTFQSTKSIEYQIAAHYCKGICQHFDPIAVPVIIHRNDLARLAPLWLKYTEDIRRDRQGPNKWPIEWNDNRFTVNRIEWVAEMFGYVIAAAHLDLRHEIADLQLVPSVHKTLTPSVPFLHYHVRVETADHKFWNKGDDHAGQRFPWPVAAGTDAVTTRLLRGLHEAYEAVGDTQRTREHKWASYFAEWNNPHNEPAEPGPVGQTATGLPGRGLLFASTSSDAAAQSSHPPPHTLSPTPRLNSSQPYLALG